MSEIYYLFQKEIRKVHPVVDGIPDSDRVDHLPSLVVYHSGSLEDCLELKQYFDLPTASIVLFDEFERMLREEL